MQMNEQLRQRAQEIADEHSNDAYSVAMAMLEREAKIKAEAVREVALHFAKNGLPDDSWSKSLEYYANKLENQND